MPHSAVAARYAKSLLNLATEQGKVDEVYADMRTLIVSCRIKDFQLLISSPLVKTDKKITAFKTIFAGRINEITEKFMVLLAKNKREGYLEKIADEFIDQYKVQKKIVTVVVTSAVKLDDATRKKLNTILNTWFKAQIELEEKIDPKLIGGFILTVGNRQADVSVLRQLKKLNKNFNQSYLLN